MTVGLDIGTGLAASLLWEALKRPIETISAEFRRHDQVVRPLTGRPSLKSENDSALLDKIIKDLSRVIANSTGQLTEEVSVFIRDLRATAIPEAIASAAMAGECSENLRSSFKEFYSRYRNLPFTSNELFDGLYEACKNRLEAVTDRALLDIIRAQHSTIMTRVEALSHSLTKGMKESSSLSADEIRDARVRIAKSIQNEHKYVSVETLRGPKKVSLKSICIPSRLATLSAAHVSSAKMPRDIPTQSYLAFRRRFSRAVVVGDPGGGKSTLTQMLSADLARLILTDAAGVGVRQIEDRDLQIPLRVILRRYEARSEKTPSYSLLDHLRDDAKAALDGDESLANGYLSSALGSGEAMIIFDGLDEVLDVGARVHMVELIEQFSASYPGCPVLVTSRLVGYRDAPLNEEFSIYGLDRFNDDEIRKYSGKAIATIGQIKRDEAAAKAADFFLQSSRIGSDIRDNPLMLGLMVQIFLVRGDVPGNRPEVYKECATLMFEKWDGRRQIVANVPRQDIELLDVFGYVASRTFGDAASEEGVTRDWLVAELRKHFSDWYVDKASANRAASSLVEFLTGRAWVMSEVGQGTFKFTHRTFLEYFFARHLISESKSIEDLIKTDLIPHVINNQWVVISHLALHMAVFRDGGKSKQAAITLENILDTDSYPPKQELAFLRFVASAVPYLVISESSFVRISFACISRSILLGAHSDVSAVSVIELLLSQSSPRVQLLIDTLSEQIQQHLSGEPTPELLFAMYATARGSELRRNVSRPTQARAKTPWDGVFIIAERNKAHLFELAKRDTAIARAYINLFDDSRSDLYEIIGTDLIVSSSSNLTPTSVDDLIFRSIKMAANARRRFSNDEVSDAKKFISALCASILRGDVELHRSLAPGRIRRRDIDVRVEDTFREIWMAGQHSKGREGFSRSLAECLLCVVSTVEPAESDNARDITDSVHAVPLGAVDNLISAVQDADIRAWLDGWLATNTRRDNSPYRRRRDAAAHNDG